MAVLVFTDGVASALRARIQTMPSYKFTHSGRCAVLLLLSLGLLPASPGQQAGGAAPVGHWEGSAWVHDVSSLKASLEQASLVLPAKATGSTRYTGPWSGRPAAAGERVPVVVFLHGSSGLGLKAIADWQQWLADKGIASVAPDSFALPGRVTYSSPIAPDLYERIHALRQSEIEPALQALRQQTWADPAGLILAGASEGAVAVARYPDPERLLKARMVFSWSCEPNYFVQEPRNAFLPGQPVLNVISSRDPYFSNANPWLGLAGAQGHCGAALKGNAAASVLLIPDAPHTLLNLPAARDATAGFLARIGVI